MSLYTRFGPGDSATYPPCYGHPNDPRTEDMFGDDDDGTVDMFDDFSDFQDDDDADE